MEFMTKPPAKASKENNPARAKIRRRCRHCEIGSCFISSKLSDAFAFSTEFGCEPTA
eukprot:CAMPEP_0177415910 /NCGR_PEP_ID=MMETSP0368-20130122/67823_1 /TAXON_ID=447022 ORGANISM="Scrippsiella hangoei-like, Strain SHHI-4" /NCGR_SAMPLE_ID=MMETSP0368 /ASSEMBLY_ACC=CAM_ASM_000363 /LENGTH=56 /DNA_ID=CAMNT_0018885365 /DNA_START=709 /DNA_END=879 /DNA_ORIENTATION=-